MAVASTRKPPSPASPARRAALEAFTRVSEPAAPGLAHLCSAAAARLRLSPQDAALAREIALGAARHRPWLEHLLARFVERPLPARCHDARDALLLGLFQAAFLDRVPDHALVNETVTLVVSQNFGGALRGLANAVMRRAVADRAALRPGDGDPWQAALSAPQWAIDALAPLLPAGEMPAFFAASLPQAPLVLRRRGVTAERAGEALRLAAGDADIAIEPSPLAPDCLRVHARGLDPASVPLFQEGKLTAQDDGAVAALMALLGDDEPARVLDFCASPGGKTALLADLLPDASITAADVSPEKLRRLRETLTRLGLDEDTRVVLSAATAGLEPFDFVLVDAPCSGLGTLRRHPEIRMRRDATAIIRLAALQRDILRHAARLVAPGGVLAYCVCTLTREEGEGTIDAFLAEHPAFSADSALARLWPHRDGCDGYTFIRLRRAA